MAKNTNEKVQFIVGKPVYVWKTTGVRESKNGGPTTSERTGQDYADIEPTEPLMVIQKYGTSKALCQRPDGSEVTVHRNHIDRSSGYYANRSKDAPATKKLSPEQELARAQDEAEAAIAALEAARSKLATTTQEVEASTEEIITEEDRDEAASLFEEAELATA